MLIFTQTNDIGVSAAGCSDATGPASSVNALVCAVGGVPGGAQVSPIIAVGQTNIYGITFVSPVGSPGLTQWDSGQWVVRINSAASSTSVIHEIFVCRAVTDLSSFVTIGSITLDVVMPLSGVLTEVINGIATTGPNSDRIFIVFTFTRGTSRTAETIKFIADQNIDTPLNIPLLGSTPYTADADFQWGGGDYY